MEELLAKVATKHDTLQSKYDEALQEISFLHTYLAAAYGADHSRGEALDDTRALNTRLAVVHEAHRHWSIIDERLAFQTEDTSEGDTKGFQADIEILAAARELWREPLHSTQPNEDDHKPESNGASNLPSGIGHSASGEIRRQSSEFLEFRRRESTRQVEEESNERCQGKAVRFLEHPVIETFLVVVLVSNCVLMWIDTDARASRAARASWITASDRFFLFLYSAEFAVRVFAYRTRVFQDKWTRLDLFIILIDMANVGSGLLFGEDIFGSLNISLFRILRLFRMARVFKVLRYVFELQLLIFGFYAAMKAAFFAVILLEIIVLLWSFVLVEFVHPLATEMQCTSCPTAYSSMLQAHLTLVRTVIAGDSWGSPNALIITAHPETSVVFVGCLVTIQFAMLNLIFTVIVDAAHRARHEDERQINAEKEQEYKRLKERLIELCKSLDHDGDGEIGLVELLEGYEEVPQFADIMTSLDIRFDDLEQLFCIMDEDRSGTVSTAELVNSIYKLKEQDIHTTLMFIKGYLVDLKINMKEEVQRMLIENLRLSKATREGVTHMIDGFGLTHASPRARRLKEKEGTAAPQQMLPRVAEQLQRILQSIQHAAQSQETELADSFLVLDDPEMPKIQLPTVPPAPQRSARK